MNRHHAVTLVELLVVVAILSVLAALLTPLFSQAQEKARQSSCINNQRQIVIALTQATQDHDETYPEAATAWSSLNLPQALLRCPTQESLLHGGSKNKSRANGVNDYTYSGFVAGKSLAAVKVPTDELMTADAACIVNDENLMKEKQYNIWLSAVSRSGQSNIFTSQADLSLRHNENFIASFCDGHVEMRQELPPIWIVHITGTDLYKQEALQSRYPVLAIFDNTLNALSAASSPSPKVPSHILIAMGYSSKEIDVNNATSTAGYLEWLVTHWAALKYRGQVKIVLVQSYLFANLAAYYNLTSPDGNNYPVTLLFIKSGKEVDRIQLPLTAESDYDSIEKMQPFADDVMRRIKVHISGAK